jgi:hypothetical protein
MGIQRTPVYIIKNMDDKLALCASLTLNVIRLDEEENKKTIKREVLNLMEA